MLATLALPVSALTCPILVFSNPLLAKFEDVVHIHFSGPIFFALLFSSAFAITAIVRIHISRGRLQGLQLAWIALVINGIWFVAVYLLGLWLASSE